MFCHFYWFLKGQIFSVTHSYGQLINKCVNNSLESAYSISLQLVSFYNVFSFFVMHCRSDAFENPVIQQHYRNLEALALNMMAPEDIEDHISKMEINMQSDIPIRISCFPCLILNLPVCLSQCQRWRRLTVVWVPWPTTLKISSTLLATTQRTNQLPNAKQVRAAVIS